MESAGLWNADAREFFAWDCLGQFDRQMLYLVDDEELAALRLSRVGEAQEKYSGDRKKAVADIARQVETTGLTRSALGAVLQHLQTTSQNQYDEIGPLQRQTFWAGVLLLVLILVVDSGLITVGKVDQKWVVAIACFLAGFSERWFLGVVSGLEKRTPSTSGKEAGHGP